MGRTGVYPCYENQFKIETKAAVSEPESPAEMSVIADMENVQCLF